MKTKAWTKVSEDAFYNVKALQEAGVKPKTITSIMGYKATTLRNISRAATYVDYKQLLKKPVPEPSQEATLQPSDQVVQALQNINDNLLTLLEHINFLVDHTPIAPKRRFF